MGQQLPRARSAVVRGCNIAEAEEYASKGEAYFSENAATLDNDQQLVEQAAAIAADRRMMPMAKPASAEGQRMVKQAKEDAVTLV